MDLKNLIEKVQHIEDDIKLKENQLNDYKETLAQKTKEQEDDIDK